MFNKGEAAHVWSQKYQFLWSFHVQGQLQPGKVCRSLFSVNEQSQNWSFAPALSLLMWQQSRGQKAIAGSLLGAKVAGKKILKTKQKPIIWMNLFCGEAENTELQQQTHRNLFILESSILNNDGEIFSSLQWIQLFNKQSNLANLTRSEVSAKLRIDGNSRGSQSAGKRCTKLCSCSCRVSFPKILLFWRFLHHQLTWNRVWNPFELY